MALVPSGFCFSSLIAWFAGRINSLILRRLASRFTSFMTGNAPVPVPITRRRHFQGIFSSTESGVCPNSPRNFLEGFFFRLRTSPRSITTSCSYLVPSMRIETKENFSKRIAPPLGIVSSPQGNKNDAIQLSATDAQEATGVARHGGEVLPGRTASTRGG